MERIMPPPSQSQSALFDRSSGLPSSCTFQERSSSSITCKEDYSPTPPHPVYLSVPPSPPHLLGRWRAIHLFLRFPAFRLEMPIMSYQDGGVVNKILKQLCLLRLSLPVPDGDYGIAEILVWPEMVVVVRLLNYGSGGEAVGM